MSLPDVGTTTGPDKYTLFAWTILQGVLGRAILDRLRV